MAIAYAMTLSDSSEKTNASYLGRCGILASLEFSGWKQIF